MNRPEARDRVERELWLTTYHASLNSNGQPKTALADADNALRAYQEISTNVEDDPTC